MLKTTPLNKAHRKLGARMVDFGGWDMPVQYTGVIEEHQAVRNAAGLFDVSHMGEVEVRGTATIGGQQRRVRSVHVYAFGAELVVDAVVEPAQAGRVGREVVAPLLRSLRLRDPGAGA